MKRGLGLLIAGAALTFGCPLLEGGGGGGGGSITFLKGFVFLKHDRNVYLADASDYSNIQRLTTSGTARHPSLSADGRQVVFVQALGSDGELMVVPTNGATPPVSLFASSSSQRNLRHPVFSPDGSQVAFAYDEGASSALALINADGSGFRRLIGGGALSYASPSFYPDGSNLLAMAGNSSSSFTQLERVSVSTGQAINVTNTLGAVTQIANRVVISPDGARAAFDGRLGSGAVRVFVIDLASRQIGQITDYPADPNAQDAHPTWVGRDKVGFSSDTGGSDQVYALPSTATKTSGGLELPSALEPWYGPN